MPCVLRISGRGLETASFSANCDLPFQEATQSARQRQAASDPLSVEVTYNLTISEASGDSVPLQIAEAEQFLATNASTLERLMQSLPGCRGSLDFSWDFPHDAFGQCNRFPADFLARMAQHGLTLVVSLYPTGPQADLPDVDRRCDAHRG